MDTCQTINNLFFVKVVNNIEGYYVALSHVMTVIWIQYNDLEDWKVCSRECACNCTFSP